MGSRGPLALIFWIVNRVPRSVPAIYKRRPQVFPVGQNGLPPSRTVTTVGLHWVETEHLSGLGSISLANLMSRSPVSSAQKSHKPNGDNKNPRCSHTGAALFSLDIHNAECTIAAELHTYSHLHMRNTPPFPVLT